MHSLCQQKFTALFLANSVKLQNGLSADFQILFPLQTALGIGSGTGRVRSTPKKQGTEIVF
jgi:hypothetical protein